MKQIKFLLSLLVGFSVVPLFSSCDKNDPKKEEIIIENQYDVVVDGLAYTLNVNQMTAELVAMNYPSTYEGDIVIPSKISAYGKDFTVESVNSAFYGSQNLTSVTIPSSIRLMDTGSFYGCMGLKRVIIEETESELSLVKGAYFDLPFNDALFENLNVEEIYIGRPPVYCYLMENLGKLKTITYGKKAFQNPNYYRNWASIPVECDNLISITNENINPVNLRYESFSNNILMKTILYVPEESLQKYKENEFWGKFWNIEPIK